MEKRKNYTFIVASSICMLLLLIVIVGNFGGKGTRAEWKIDQDFCMGEYNVLVQESYCCKYEEEIIENHPHICSASTVDNDIYEYEGTYYLAKGKSKLVGDLDKCNYSMICIKPGEAVPMETCSTENLTECNSDTTCTDKGGVWENNQCHKKQSSNTGTEEEFNCPKGSSYLQYNGMFGSKNYCCDNNEISYNIPYPNICADYVKFTLVNDNDYVLEKNGCNVKIKRCINELYLDECKNGE